MAAMPDARCPMAAMPDARWPCTFCLSERWESGRSQLADPPHSLLSAVAWGRGAAIGNELHVLR